MSTPRGSAEAEIRAAVVARLRELLPASRIVHELNVDGGSNRIDVAAVGRQTIVGVEIKSERDTLARLGQQWETFGKACHLVLVAAHEKHFVEHGNERRRAELPRRFALNHPLFLTHSNYPERVWRYPRAPLDPAFDRQTWTFDTVRDLQRQPRAWDLLNLLWAEELRAECYRHKLPAGSKLSRPPMLQSMVWNLTGREIAEAVCRQLRARSFANADEAIWEKPE